MCLFHRYLDRIIRLSELEEFSALLTPHQKATTADGEGGTQSRGHCSYVRWRYYECGLFMDHVSAYLFLYPTLHVSMFIADQLILHY